MAIDTTAALAPDETRRLIDFARAFKAAASAIVLYPSAHPTIGAALGRIVEVTSRQALSTSLRISVLADSLTLGGLAPERPDAAIGELAVLLHGHLIGECTVHVGGDIDAWRRFLVLVSRTPEDVRDEGGLAQVWSRMSGRHVELRELDYAEVLREREATGHSTWSDIVEHCLRGERLPRDDDSRRRLMNAAGDAGTLGSLVAALDAGGIGAGSDEHTRAATLVTLLDRVVETAAETTPGQVDMVMDALAAAVGRLSPDMMMAVFSRPGSGLETPGLIHAIFNRMPEDSTARFVAHHAMAADPSTERLAQVFQTLVPKAGRERLLAHARAEASATSAGLPRFDERWQAVTQALLTFYSDKSFVSEEYGSELSRAHETASGVEQIGDDPPERLKAWRESVNDSELRKLDLALVHDLLRLVDDAQHWAALMAPLIALVNDQLLVGDFEAADSLVKVLVHERLSGTARRQAAADAILALVAGPMLRLVSGHLATIEDTPFQCVSGTFLAIGEPMIAPLADALIEDVPSRTRERLSALLIAFGAISRREVERLKGSPNVAVRRTAIDLLRRSGGNEALPDLSGFLNDPEPQLQREAVRVILGIGTDRAWTALGRAITEGTPIQREALLTTVNASRDSRAAPLYAYILRHVDHRGPLMDLYSRAIIALGTLKAADGIDPLKEALHRGEWWAPRRTTLLRNASAAALARIGTPDAVGVLEAAAASGGRGVRAAARAHLPTAAERAGNDARR